MMQLSTIGSRNVATVAPQSTAAEIVRTMDERNVGSVIVAQEGKVLGIVTDRDLVLRVLARGLDPRRVPAQLIMSHPVLCVRDHYAPHEAAARMRERQVRRLPVLDQDDRMVGIVTLDDLVHHFGHAQGDLAEAISSMPVHHAGG